MTLYKKNYNILIFMRLAGRDSTGGSADRRHKPRAKNVLLSTSTMNNHDCFSATKDDSRKS